MNNGDATPLTLQLAEDKKSRAWAMDMVQRHHYLHRPLHPKSDPLVYLVKRDQDNAWVGCIMFNRLQCSRVRGWFGSLDEVHAGKCSYTQWELICLSRVWLSPLIQRLYPEAEENARVAPCSPVPQFLFDPGTPLTLPVYHAASSMILAAIERVPYDYLLRFPPPFPEEPWRLRQCVSYCDTRLFNCSIYQASRFRAVRENKGIRTYVHHLGDLTEDEEKNILAASKINQRCRRHRAARDFAKRMNQPTIFKGKRTVSTITNCIQVELREGKTDEVAA